MGRDATKAAGNPWYQARKKAAEYDDRLCSRESAAEQLGMSVSSLADAELGNTKFMPVDKAVLMADRYNAPWLLNHYCLNECPIGCRHSLSDEVVGIDRVTVKLLKSLKTEQLGEVKDTLLDIAADGKITEDEKPALQEVLTYLDDLAKTVSELKTIGEMALNEDGDAHGSKYVYACLVSKKCCICGKPCDLHHVDHVGAGRDREEIIHEGMEVLPLCREHHSEVHVIGWLTFQKKHHLTRGVLLDKHLCKLYRLKRKEKTENAEQDNLDGQIDP